MLSRYVIIVVGRQTSVCAVVVDVISLDDSRRINNSPFINSIMKQALLTPAYVYSLENKTTTDFRHFADSLTIPLEDDVYHPAYDGFHLSELCDRNLLFSFILVVITVIS